MKIQNFKSLNSNWFFQLAFLILVLLKSNFAFSQFTIPPKPDFQTSVYDYAKLFNEVEKTELEKKLIKYSDSTTTQIVVVTIPTIKGEDIGILAPKWGHEWGVGQAKEDNGIFILVAAQERKIWIATGYGAEVSLVAGINGEIIRNIIIPEFKAGSYYNGIDKGADAIFDVLKGKYKGTRKVESKNDGLPIFVFIIIFIIIIIIISRNKGNGSGIGRSPSLLDVIILSNMGRSSGGSFGSGGFGGSSGSGGFGGGFGGGGFSGGGAGGSW